MAHPRTHYIEVGEGPLRQRLGLFLGINELILLQKAIGVESEAEFMAKFEKLMGESLSNLRKFFHQGLLREQPDMTEDQAGDLITELGIEQASVEMRAMLKWVFPEPKPATAATGKAIAPSPGTVPS